MIEHDAIEIVIVSDGRIIRRWHEIDRLRTRTVRDRPDLRIIRRAAVLDVDRITEAIFNRGKPPPAVITLSDPGSYAAVHILEHLLRAIRKLDGPVGSVHDQTKIRSVLCDECRSRSAANREFMERSVRTLVIPVGTLLNRKLIRR